MERTVNEIVALEHRKLALKLELDELEKQEDELKSSLMEDMVSNNLDVIETEEIRIKYVAPVVRDTLDTSKLKKEYPEVALKCLKQIETKASWKITLKGE